MKEMRYITRRDGFTYPVCFDEGDELNRLNHFPAEMAFQTFLLDADNRVVALGNPVHSVFKFSEEGRLVGKINRQGEAPDEYLNVSDFQIDDNGDVWVLCRSNHSLYLYSWDNRLKKRYSVDLWIENIRLMKDKLFLYTGNEISGDNACQLHVFDLSSGKVIRDFNPSISISLLICL